MTPVRSICDAKRVRNYLRGGGTGWFITYYEALSRNGRKFELLPHFTHRHPNPRAGQEVWDYDRGDYVTAPDYVELDSSEFCPGCCEPA